MFGLGLGLSLGSHRPPVLSRPPSRPHTIILSSNEVAEDAANGTVIGYLFTYGGAAPYSYALTVNPGSRYAIANGKELQVASSLDGITTDDITVEVTDDNSATFEQQFTLTIQPVENDSGVDEDDGEIVVPDPEDPETDEDGFEEPPIQQDTSEGLKLTGKNGGTATWFKSLPLPPAGSSTTFSYVADYSAMTKQGRDAAIGFVFKDGNEYHLTGVKGNGSANTQMRAARISGDFRKANQFTINDDGAATDCVKNGPNFLKIEVDEDGETYEISVGDTLDGLTVVGTGRAPSPIDLVSDATEFGIGGYFSHSDKGVFQITLTLFATEGYAETDPHFANVVLLVGFEGADGATSAVDDSNSAHTLTFADNAQLDTGVAPPFGTSALLLDGSGDVITTGDSEDWNFGSGDFTIEAFIRRTAVNTLHAICAQYQASSRGWIFYPGNQTLQFLLSINGTNNSATLSQPWTHSADTWLHAAVTRTGGTMYFFGAGALLGSSASTHAIFNSTEGLRIGAINGAGFNFAGRMKDLRITKGVARYTSAFTPPTGPFPRQ